MKWFKFYGQDWLTDPKILGMNTVDKILYLTLLCMASAENKGGLISRIDEYSLIKLSGIEYDPMFDNSEHEKAQGFLQRVNDNAMITLHDNGDVTVNAFQKRQGSNLSGYERVKKYREKKLNKAILQDDNTNDNVHDNTNDNVRIDKNRIDKNNHKAVANAPASPHMIKHNESRHSTDDEPVIDSETGRIEKKPEDPSYTELMSFWQSEIGVKFMNRPKQYKAIKTMRANGFSDEQIKGRALLMKNETFYQEHGFDFMSVLSDFSKRKSNTAPSSITIR